MNTPTTGAIRAATAILEAPDLGEDPMLDTSKIAQLIDRETALPDVLAALKQLVSAEEFSGNGEFGVVQIKRLESAIKAAKAAIANAEGIK